MSRTTDHAAALRAYQAKGPPTRGEHPGTWEEFAGGLEGELVKAITVLADVRDAIQSDESFGAVVKALWGQPMDEITIQRNSLIRQIDYIIAERNRWHAAAVEKCEEKRKLKAALGTCRTMLKQVVEEISVPDPDCHCHINPPCNDCVDNAGMRELLKQVHETIESTMP